MMTMPQASKRSSRRPRTATRVVDATLRSSLRPRTGAEMRVVTSEASM